MPGWEGKSRGNKPGYEIFVWILKSFGVFPAYFLLRFVSFYFFLFSSKSSKEIFRLFHKRLGFSRTASFFKVYRNYYQFGQSLIDRIVVMSGMPNRFSFDFDGEKYLREIVAAGNGGLLLSAHVGNWEIAGHLLKRLGTKINVVMFDGEHEQIKQYLTGVTGERNVNVIVIKNDISHIYQISEALSRKELICMHADRFLEGNKVKEVDFLGSPAKFPIGPFVLASTFKVPCFFCFCYERIQSSLPFFCITRQKRPDLRERSTHN